jgi:hypothetical protein
MARGEGLRRIQVHGRRLVTPRPIITVLVAVTAAQMADLITFVRLMGEHGALAEANPLVHHGVVGMGPEPFILAKAVLVVFIAAAFSVVGKKRARMAHLVATVAVLAGLIGAYSNVFAL